MWDKDSEGRALSKPIDAFNHAIDPMRYLAIDKLSKQKQKRGLKRRN
jgi:phage terminase large subunit